MRTQSPSSIQRAEAPSAEIPAVEELTLNWHITEACNFRCKYCYAKWKDDPNPRELFHDSGRSRELLIELVRFFHPSNRSNPLRRKLSWKAVRLNLAGGEPSVLGNRFLEIVRTAREIGFQVSIISNGSGLTTEVIRQLAPQLTCLGISLDSARSETNREIGRTDRRGKLLNLDELVANLDLARQINPRLSIKLNTVVNLLNAGEDLSGLLEKVRPDRWKILRMLPVINDSLAVSDAEFSAFVQRHRSFRSVQCIEDNQDMYESYLMIDPSGRFFQNDPSIAVGYLYSKPILATGVRAAFTEMSFRPDSFQSRYNSGTGGK